mgnify:CR=1 FL=1
MTIRNSLSFLKLKITKIQPLSFGIKYHIIPPLILKTGGQAIELSFGKIKLFDDNCIVVGMAGAFLNRNSLNGDGAC